MSAKRSATTELNHDNWDQDDPSEHEEMGTFKAAPQDVLEKRVIRTAKRRSQGLGTEPSTSVFSGFGGFNKTQPTSFDFLANVTNGTNTKQDEPNSKPAAASSLFSSSAAGSTNGGFFGMPMTSTPSKPPGGTSTQSSLFGALANKSSPSSSLFSTSTTGNTMFKGPSTDQKKTESQASFSSSSTFGSSSMPNTVSQPTIPVTDTKSATPLSTQINSNTDTKKNDVDSEKDGISEEKRQKYYGKLRALNESVSDWIKKHVQETPLCILSPIFKDYEKYLKEMQDEYLDDTEKTTKPSEITTDKESKPELETAVKSADSDNAISESDSEPNILSGKGVEQTSPFGGKTGFSFGAKPSSESKTPFASSGFFMGANTATASSASPLSMTTAATNANSTVSFAFSNQKPSFSFNSSVQQTPVGETNTESNEDDEPPKVEFTPVVEKDSVYDKKCKIFLKKDGNFTDRGVGTLYVKKVENSEKYQLLVRANTNLGNILLNLILTSDTPTQRLGKNNVMMVCIPTPDAKPPPVPVLVRVKTSEEADELLETLNKFKA